MDRTEVTKKIVSVKVKKGLKWETIAKKFPESKEWVVTALLGQMQTFQDNKIVLLYIELN